MALFASSMARLFGQASRQQLYLRHQHDASLLVGMRVTEMLTLTQCLLQNERHPLFAVPVRSQSIPQGQQLVRCFLPMSQLCGAPLPVLLRVP